MLHCLKKLSPLWVQQLVTGTIPLTDIPYLPLKSALEQYLLKVQLWTFLGVNNVQRPLKLQFYAQFFTVNFEMTSMFVGEH